MQSITKNYLVEIIDRSICRTIHIHRQSRDNLSFYDTPNNWPPVTDEEITEFIFMIPYFDEKLKNFLLGNMWGQPIIISQTWEIEFIKKCILWADSKEWLLGVNQFLSNTHLNNIEHTGVALTLPY